MRSKHLVVTLVLLAVVVPASPAHAGGVVSVCDEAHLLAALAGGGTVTFACSGTITLTNTIVIEADTTIDGSGQTVDISGDNYVRVFYVNSGVTLNVNELGIANGVSYYYDAGGGIYNGNGSTVIVSNSTFLNNSAASAGGGIYSTGTLTVSDSNFLGNSAGLYYDGGGIYNSHSGTLDVRNSTFSDNTAGDGAGIANHGSADVSNSVFSVNDASSFGGAILNAGGSNFTLTVSNSTFSNNTALNGGGVYNVGVAQVGASTFSGNSASYGGGGVYNDARVNVSTSTFSDNSASYGGGIGNYRELFVSNSTFSGNGADRGGGIGNRFGNVTVSNSTLSGNSASYDGGGISNSDGGVVTLQNTIVANSPTGNNCFGAIIDGSGNLSYPGTTCPGINADPLLGPLQINGGPTETMPLGPGSAAINAGTDANCAAAPVNNRDQRGIARPQGVHCDIGAVEQYCPSFVPPVTVGVEDIVAVVARWGWTNSAPGWDPVYDLNGDNKIDMVDIILVTRTWGATCS